MTDSTYTDIVFVCDRSGSMGGAADGPYTKAQRSTDGVRSTVEDQLKLPGKVRFSLYEFDTIYDCVAEAAQTLEWTCQPRGGTALLDAVGRSISDTITRIEAMSEDAKPERVMFVIATDGEENSSVEFELDAVKLLIEKQKLEGWDFLFVGEGINAWDEGVKMGMSADSSIAVAAASYNAGWNVTTESMNAARSNNAAAIYTEDQRKRVKDAENK